MFIPSGWKTTYMEQFCLPAKCWTNRKQKQMDFRPSYGRCVAKKRYKNIYLLNILVTCVLQYAGNIHDQNKTERNMILFTHACIELVRGQHD